MTPEEAFLAEVSRQIDECMAKIGEPRWLIANPPPAPASARACKAPEWCGQSRHVFLNSPVGQREAWWITADVSDARAAFCSPACRDANLPSLAAKAACQPWCGRALPDDGVAVYGFIDGPGDEREFFKLSGATCRRKGYVLGWCSMECRDKAAQPAEIKRTEGHIRLCRVNRGGDCNCTGLAQPAEQPKPAKGHDFSDPYCATAGERMCVACGADQDIAGAFRGRGGSVCTPRPGWRESREAAVLAQGVGYVATRILRDADVPALIDRRLAHSPMWPDDDGGA